ncbi:MAG: Lacal_2735 family protein [Bacteroidota bacterium]|nr:Lacal_2735 family protein [Bacteroidota bacterium]
MRLFELTMFGLFKKKSKKDILLAKYKKLNEEAYKLSHHDRKASDKKLKEANDILEQINALEEKA